MKGFVAIATLFCLWGVPVGRYCMAAVVITSEYEPTPGLPGYFTFTLTATADVFAGPIQGFDFVGDPDNNEPETGLGFFGPLHQRNPANQPTVFQDANVLFSFLGWDVKQDSQFLWSTTTPGVVVPPGFSEENGELLQGVFAFFEPQGLSLPFVQLVIPGSGEVSYRGAILNDSATRSTNITVFGSVIAPDPIVVNNLSFVNGVLYGEVEGFVTGTYVVDWSELTFLDYTPDFGAPIGAAGLNLSPDWDPDSQSFHWDTTGSSRGIYRWQVTGSNSVASESAIIRIEQRAVPEPAAFLLVWLGCGAAAGLRLRCCDMISLIR